MWTPERMPPTGWNLSVLVGCPECGKALYFKFGGHGQPARNSPYKQVYCANPACLIENEVYWIILTSGECRVASPDEIPK